MTSITPSNASAMIGGSYGDRKLKPQGLTALTANNIEIGSWELKPATLCTKFCLALKCSEEDLGRSAGTFDNRTVLVARRQLVDAFPRQDI